MDDLVKLTVGFLLTTLCGGLLGFIFQRRHARYQWVRSRWEKELSEAQSVFEEVSRLLDQRLYRTRQLLWSLNRESEFRTERLGEYRKVVTGWNDNINRILALLSIHFSDQLRLALDQQIGAEFVRVGRSLEQVLRGESTIDRDSIEVSLDGLALRVYTFNIELLNSVRDRRSKLYHDV